MYENFIECTQSMNNLKNDWTTLNKCISDLVHAMRQHYKKAVKILKKAGFSWGSVDPCLYIKKCQGQSIHSSVCRWQLNGMEAQGNRKGNTSTFENINCIESSGKTAKSFVLQSEVF